MTRATAFPYTRFDVIEKLVKESAYNRTKNAYLAQMSRNLERLPTVLINCIKSYIGLYDEETEHVYFNNGVIKSQLEQLPDIYSPYCSLVFKSQYNHAYDCVMEYNIDKNNSLLLSHRMNSKETQHRYYIGKFNRDTHCDECMATRCANKWYCLGVSETVESYKTHYVGESLDVSVIMFWGILNDIKTQKK